jgi:hypothetical protein
MNTLEDRLRETLAERAQCSPIDPDAWDKTIGRRRKRSRRGQLSWPAWFRSGLVLPVAAAATVAAIILTATSLAGSTSRSGPATSSASPAGGGTPAVPTPSGAPAPPGRNNYLIQTTPPVTAIVPVKSTSGRQPTWTFLWFGYMKSDRAEGIMLCSVTDGGNYYGSGGCAPIQSQAQKGFVEGTGSITLGVAARQVIRASALLSSGRSVTGTVAYGAGFPDKVWLVNYPTASTARIVLRDAAGNEVTHLTVTGH